MKKVNVEPTWRNNDLFKYLKELNHDDYLQMLAYIDAGGELDMQDESAKKWYEKQYKKRLQHIQALKDGTYRYTNESSVRSMRNLKEVLNESRVKKYNETLGDFLAWYFSTDKEDIDSSYLESVAILEQPCDEYFGGDWGKMWKMFKKHMDDNMAFAVEGPDKYGYMVRFQIEGDLYEMDITDEFMG
jgi:hypothetical protein